MTSHAVVALPGTFCSPLVFEPLRPLLRDRFALRTLPWMTDAPSWTIGDVAAWAADSLSEPVLVLGHSTGGAVALQLTLTRPDLVAGLMVLDTGPNMHGHGDVTTLIASLERDGTGDVARAVVERSFHRAPPPEDLRRLHSYARAAPAAAALEMLRSQHTTDLAPRLPELRMPVSVVHGRFDPARTVDVARGMADAIPDATLAVVDTGHTPMYEAPETIADAIGDLADRVTSRAAQTPP